MNLSSILETTALVWPERVAVTDDKVRLTYSELLTQSRIWSKHFYSLAAASSRPVVYIGPNSTAMLAVLFGAFRSGRAFLPVNYRLGSANLAEVIDISQPAVVIAGSRYLTLIERSANAIGAQLLELSDGDDSIRLSDSQPPPPAEGGNAILLFTSGTSAAPKLVRLSHEALGSYVLKTAPAASAAEAEAGLLATPIYHIAAIANVISSISRGRRLVMLGQFNPESWVQLATTESVTHAMLVPTMLAQVLKYLDSQGQSPPRSLRQISYGGSPAPRSVIEKALTTFGERVDLINAYGLTETSSTISMLDGDAHRRAIAGDATDAMRARLESVGRPITGVEVRIVMEDERRARPGEVGELRVRGPQLASGYTNSGLNLDSDGFLKTGDAAMVDTEGFIYVKGRMDDMIIRGGENMSPSEIEEALLRIQGVDDVLVTSVPDTEWGELIAACVVLEDDGPSFQELETRVRQFLPGYKVPTLWKRVEEIPRNDLGKPLRKRARDLFQAESPAD